MPPNPYPIAIETNTIPITLAQAKRDTPIYGARSRLATSSTVIKQIFTKRIVSQICVRPRKRAKKEESMNEIVPYKPQNASRAFCFLLKGYLLSLWPILPLQVLQNFFSSKRALMVFLFLREW
jgi:hypothetical protein